MRRPNPERETVLLAAFDGGDEDRRLVGAAKLQLPLQDNTHMAYADVDVPVENRRRGIGSRLLAEVEARARRAGRSHVLSGAFCPPGGSSAGREFGRASGYAEAGLEQQKVIDLRERGPALDALEAEVLGGLSGHRIVTWGAEAPDEYIESYCRLLSVFIAEMPVEDLVLEDSEWTPARVRANEERARDIGRVSIVAAAVAPDGTLAGVNEHMNAINDRMGYRVVEDLLDLQKAL